MASAKVEAEPKVRERVDDAGALRTIAALLGMKGCVGGRTSGAKPSVPGRRNRPQLSAAGSLSALPTPGLSPLPSPGPWGCTSPLKGAPRRPEEVALPEEDACCKAMGHGSNVMTRSDSTRSDASTLPANSPNWGTSVSCGAPTTPGKDPGTPGAPCGPTTPSTVSSRSRQTSERGSRRGLEMDEGEHALGVCSNKVPLELHLELTLVIRAWKKIASEGARTPKIPRHTPVLAGPDASTNKVTPAVPHKQQLGTSSSPSLSPSSAAAATDDGSQSQEQGQRLASLDRWLTARARTTAKRDAFHALLEHSLSARAESESARLQSKVEGLERQAGLIARLKGIVERQAKLAASQESKIGQLRTRADHAEARVGISEARQRSLEATVDALVKTRAPSSSLSPSPSLPSSSRDPSRVVAQVNREGLSNAEERLERSMQMLKEGLIRSGASTAH